MTARLRDRQDRDESGITLVEVTLTMLILSIVLVMAFDFLDRTTNITVKTETHARTEDDTQRVLRTVTQHIRGALPITGTCTTAGYATTYDNCIRFTVPRGVSGIGSCARSEFVIGLVGTGTEKKLMYDRRDFTGSTSCTAGPLSSQVLLLDRVVNTSLQPLFTYYASDGSQINTTSSAASVPNAATVNVNVRVRYRMGSNPIVMTSSAALRNNITR
ncbi:MAG TPA: prepilin-type N-terminal cleavage/methylation domain-containing protein [Acidimicrobiales bacterium]|nr:prepilin-type N-terminal cleavage/methylation domain-containing protein [Acidimicrobiales bacterium]